MRFLSFLILIAVLAAPAAAQDLVERQAREEAIAAFRATGMFSSVIVVPGTVVRVLAGPTQVAPDATSPREIADTFVRDHLVILGLKTEADVAFAKVVNSGNGQSVFTYDQVFNGVPVHERDLVVTVATEDLTFGPQGSILFVLNDTDIVADIAPENAPVLERAAIEASVNSWQDSACSVAFRSATLTLLPQEFSSTTNHVYTWAAVMDERNSGYGPYSYTVFMDAETGAPLYVEQNFDPTPGGPFQSSCVSTAVDGPHEVMPFAVYPNPVQSWLTVRGAESVDVTDILGRVVASGTGTVDMSRLPSGLYLVRRTGTDEMRTVVRM